MMCRRCGARVYPPLFPGDVARHLLPTLDDNHRAEATPWQ